MQALIYSDREKLHSWRSREQKKLGGIKFFPFTIYSSLLLPARFSFMPLANTARSVRYEKCRWVQIVMHHCRTGQTGWWLSCSLLRVNLSFPFFFASRIFLRFNMLNVRVGKSKCPVQHRPTGTLTPIMWQLPLWQRTQCPHTVRTTNVVCLLY